MEAEDPDYLCALAFSLNDRNPDRRNVVDRPLKNGESKRAAVLDALARLLVHKGRDQVVAVGAGLNAGHVEFYVTENTAVSPLTVPHLHNICTRLIDIRATIQASPDHAAILRTISSPVHLKADTAESAFASLRGLQLSLVSHSIERIQARFTKLHWPNKVDHVLTCIIGPPAKTRVDLSERERRALEELQASTIVQLSVRQLGDAVQLIRESIDQGSNYDVDKVRRACIALATVVNTIPAHTMVSFDQFIFAYVNRIHEPPRKSPNMAKWLKKVSFVIAEYRSLLKILTTPSLSALFGDHVVIHSVVNRPPRRAFVTNLEIGNITTTFDDLGFNARNFKNIQDLVVEVAHLANHTKVKLVHCECALLCHLDQLGQAMLPYIGVSKLSCAFCDMYFDCYRRNKESEVRTRGTYGQTTAWMWPDLPDDGPIRTMFCRKLRLYLQERLEDAKAQSRASMDSQSTSASDDIEGVNDWMRLYED
ncbi:uncharacterized protein TRAVEDRAFT_65024 [Trametes versicolor FP-101664 SS1]|uniref:uncharacterized protein n=1 Tax=Trametes versicolor (strain FP-101664) TaxID=717944 RepID=UPI0004624693|nr:uncharacterized protein TRAVEDRAFT_65024 [Trametes versicolor FP-101664 SS1]EIW58739.1 hypothetical protein TRAVEDRAFT_65024 [Trametes versicolor FP-101664 SS1]